MAECQVLRCTDRAAHVRDWGPPDALRLEGVVCDAHHERMEAGEPWAHVEEAAGARGTGSAFLMGDDLVAADLTTVTGVGGNNATVLADRSRPWVMKIEGERYGDNAPVSTSIILTADAVEKLRRQLDFWGPSEGE